MHTSLARQHFTVSLAEEIRMENSGVRAETTEITRTFRASGQPTSELFEQADMIVSRFYTGSWLLGGFLGLVVALKLIRLSVWKKHTEYSADTGNCLSCGRCFSYCPFEIEQRKDKNQLITLDGY